MKSSSIQFIASSRFDAARSVKIFPKGHKSHNLHGHSFWASILTDADRHTNSNGLEHINLMEKLAKITNQLDYSFLNEMLNIPTDENLAKWIRKNSLKSLKNIAMVIGLQSTKDQGVHLGENDDIHVWKRFQFEAAHQLPNVPVGHKCGRMHGHSFQVIVHANIQLGSNNLSIDYETLSNLWSPIDNLLNYNCLNDIEGLNNPTSEILAKWIWEKIILNLPSLSCVSVYETALCGAHFDGNEFKIWKDFSIDSAIKIDKPFSKINRLHGHTFLLRLNLSSPLDKVMGWTKDFGDVKQLFSPIFKTLDHHPLHQNLEIQNFNLLNMAKWILKTTEKTLPEVSGLELYETEGCGVILNNKVVGPTMPLTQK